MKLVHLFCVRYVLISLDKICEHKDHDDEEDHTKESALTAALAKGARVEGKQIRRPRINVSDAATETTETKEAPRLTGDAPTPRKSGIKKTVQRQAIKAYKIYK